MSGNIYSNVENIATIIKLILRTNFFNIKSLMAWWKDGPEKDIWPYQVGVCIIK